MEDCGESAAGKLVGLLVVETKASLRQGFFAQPGEICPAYPSQILKIIERLLIGEKILAVNIVIPCAVVISAHGLCQYGS
jgi:hypothetical protein